MISSPHPRRWIMIAFAFLATLVNYLDRQTLSVEAPVLRERFQMTNIDYSHVVFAFLLAYTVMNGVSGHIIDKLGTRLGYALFMGWWSVASILHCFATGTRSLSMFRCLLGMGESGNWPAGVKVVADWFPREERALASGIFNSGAAVGAILAPPVIAFLLLRSGWQSAFIATGAIGLVWFVLWFALYQEPAVTSIGVREPLQFAILVRSRFVRAFTLAKAFIDPCWYFYIFWFPDYLRSARHFSILQIGKWGWIPFLVAAAGNVAGGLLAKLLLQTGLTPTQARKLATTIFLSSMMAALPAVFAQSYFAAIALISVAMFGYTGSTANMLAFPADVFPQQWVGSVYGLASMGSGLGGMVTTLIAGWAIDHYSYRPVFVGFGLLPLLGAAVIWAALGPLTLTAEVTQYGQSTV